MQVISFMPIQGADTKVQAVYDDTVVVPSNSLPPGAIIIRFIQQQYLVGEFPPTLTKDWVNDLPNITTSEGARRVEQCFTAAQQRAASLLVQNDMMQYGNDTSAWPSSEQTRYSEVQRGLAYINTMNAAQQAIVDQTILDPCNDQYWPTPIDPIQL